MRRHPFAASVLVGLTCSIGLAEDRLDPKKLDAIREIIRPTQRELKWSAIPWMTSLWEARRRAAAEDKPILLWEMDGHPLGCT